MRFLVDECCPYPLAARLAGLGHDVMHAGENSPGQSDLAQADLAFASGRVLISADYDFGKLAVRRQKRFHGLVLIAPRPEGLLPVVDRLAGQIHGFGDGLLGHLTLLEAKAIRRRPIFWIVS